MRSMTRNVIAVIGIVAIVSASFMVSNIWGLVSVGVSCLLVAVGDRIGELKNDRKRTG